MPEFRLLDTGPISAARNMALDEVLTSRAGKGTSPPTLRFLQFKPDAALLGFHQQAERELRLAFCSEQGIDVNRRLTGGGALLFQESALGWELVGPAGVAPFAGPLEAAHTRICQAAAAAFSRLGVEARFRPRNDIEVGGRKISGTGGFTLDGGVLFQGTVLVKNQIERFLRALRVPVEKLKKREIESLMQRLAFLEELVGGPVDMARLKAAVAHQFSEQLGIGFTPGGLSAEETAAVEERLPYFESDEWVFARRGPEGRPAWLKSILQTNGGTLRVHLWLDSRGRLIQKALITGDFFSHPQRLVMDLEAALMGIKAEPRQAAETVRRFLETAKGELIGVSPLEAALAVARAAACRELASSFTPEEAAELFLVGMTPAVVGARKPSHLLLPYCAKPVECDFRKIPDCGLCGDCQFEPLYELGHELDMEPVSIQSFEHLMVVLGELSKINGSFLGSCCEAFYTKHQMEMEESGTPGLLVNVDSTTCYDLGKGMEAYVGNFDHQTVLNLPLIQKAARVMCNGG